MLESHNLVFNKREYEDGISAGSGYSSDSQQIATEICYNATQVSNGDITSTIRLDASQSFSDLQRALHTDVGTGGGYSIFSADAQSSYMRSIEDTSYSLSLNYYQNAKEKITVQLSGFGRDALTAEGKAFYQNADNPYFGLSCGDNYITSYQEGALLVMSLNIQFASHDEKVKFINHAGISFADIITAYAKIEKASDQLQLNGSVVIQAFQKGGNPSELAKILGKDSSGKYHALSCDLSHMQDCKDVANDMLEYARDNFSKQVLFAKSQGVVELGIGFAEYMPIHYIDLVQPTSFVTKQVQKSREVLEHALKENQYYQFKFHQLLEYYPVKWDVESSLYKKIQSLDMQVINNVNIIMNEGDINHGAIGCFNLPDQCNKIKEDIISAINPITGNDLSSLDGIKYYMPVHGGYFYNNGHDWGHVPAKIGDTLHEVTSMSLTDTHYAFDVYFFDGNDHSLWHGWFSGTSKDTLSYKGDLYTQPSSGGSGNINVQIIEYTKHLSPYYFMEYEHLNNLEQASEIELI